MMEAPVSADQRVTCSAVEPEGRQYRLVLFDPCKDVGLGRFEQFRRKWIADKLRHLPDVGDSGVSRNASEQICAFHPKTQRTVTAHGESSDEDWRLFADAFKCAGHTFNYIVSNPPFK